MRDLVEDLLHAEPLFGGEVFVHEQTEQVLVFAVLECRPPAGGFLFENFPLLLAHELETDAAHRLLRLGDYRIPSPFAASASRADAENHRFS
jgi:hypothetical protein